MSILSLLIRFWSSRPGLLYGVAFVMGCFALFNLLLSLFVFFVVLLPFLIKIFKGEYEWLTPLLLALLLAAASWLLGISTLKFPEVPSEGIVGTVHIEILSLSNSTTFFGKQWVYRCQLNQFFPHDSEVSIAKGIRCTVSLPQKPHLNRPLANQNYVLEATLLKTDNGAYILKPLRQHPWHPIKESWSLGEWRFQSQETLSHYIQQHYSNSKSSSFLAGLATGHFDDKGMQIDFARFGLQHIMAISGFHFAIIAAFLSLFFGLVTNRRNAALIVMLLLSGYLLFLGNSASVIRAWIMISIAMAGTLLSKQASALNSLGIALIVVLAIDPLQTLNLGFQFSFLTTAAILLCFSPFDYLMSEILPKRPLSEMVQMNGWNQHGYCLLAYFRQGLALTAAVNLFAWPLMLYHFHQIPLMSLFYNLFFPLFVSFSMTLLLVGLVVYPLFPPLGNLIHAINNSYTKWILNLTSNLPPSVDVYLQVDTVPLTLVVGYVTTLLLAAICLKAYFEQKRLEALDLAYL